MLGVGLSISGDVVSLMDSHTDSLMSSVATLASTSLSFAASLKQDLQTSLSGKAGAPHTQQAFAAGRVWRLWRCDEGDRL